MALSLQLGFPDVPQSITNPNVNKKDAQDVSNPFPYLTFIKLINVSFEPDSLQQYYGIYIKAWNNIVVSSDQTDEQLIIDGYRNLLQEITLNFTTLEEKQFLSKIDFYDPLDLDVAMGFYGRKLREITQFYNNKRNDIKFNLIRNKLKGTNFGSEKTISELTLHYLRSLDEGKILYDYNVIQDQIEIEIEELFDSYPLYFNQDPDPKVYDKKDLDYGMDLFLKSNTQLIEEFFSDLSQEAINLKELDAVFDNKRALTQKNVFTDFYFLSTGNTVNQILSGKLFESDRNINAFLNRDFPTSVSTEQECCVVSPRQKGFFRPLNTTIVLLDGQNGTFSYNLSNLEPNKLYYFPDPNILGKNGDIITFIVDDSFLKKHISSGNAVNQPATTPFDTKYYGYVSKHDPNIQKNLDSVFDRGFIKDAKRDIYGNMFGLFQNSVKHTSALKEIPVTDQISMVVNGYLFYDELYGEGFGFNYTTSDDTTYNETIRTGLSSYTNGFLYSSPLEFTISPGAFIPYEELTSPTEDELLPNYEINDGAFIIGTETMSTDLSAFDYLPGSYYFSIVIEGALATSSPTQRALLDPSFPSLTADATQFIRNDDLFVYDGDYIGIPSEFDVALGSPVYGYSDELNQPTVFYSLSDLPSQFYGRILVRNSTTRTVDTLTEMLPYLPAKYSVPIIDEINNNVEKFEVVTDVIIIETTNYLVFDKIKFDKGVFENPKVVPIDLPHNTNGMDKLSNRFKINNYVYYCQLYTTTESVSSTVTVYPKIYRFDTINFKNDLLFNAPLDIFTITSDSVVFDHVDPPTLTYNSRNNIFKLSYLLKDQNNTPTLFEYDFIVEADVTFLSKKEYSFNGNGYSTIFKTVPPELDFYLASGPIVTQDFELIL